MGRRGKTYFSPSFIGICIELDWLKIQKNSRSLSPPGRGGGPLIKVLYWEAPPRGPTPYPFINHFRHKRYPFVYLISNKWYSFQNFASPYINFCKCSVCKIYSKSQTGAHKTVSFLDFFAAMIKRRSRLVPGRGHYRESPTPRAEYPSYLCICQLNFFSMFVSSK